VLVFLHRIRYDAVCVWMAVREGRRAVVRGEGVDEIDR
jgi:hypothetical protein